MTPEDRKEFCPNCEAETPCTHEAELFVCDICGEDFAKYIVSRNCNVSDVSMTQDVLTDIKTPRSIENNNPDYCKDAEKTALVRLCGVLGVLTENNDLATAALLAATRIERLEKKIPALNVDLAEASMHAYNGEIARMKLEGELARRNASLLTEGEQKEILSYIRGNYDRDKIPTWLLDLIDGIARRDEIIKRLVEDGERLAYHCVRRNHFEQYICVLCDAYADTIEEIQHDPDCDVLKHRTLMKELN